MYKCAGVYVCIQHMCLCMYVYSMCACVCMYTACVPVYVCVQHVCLVPESSEERVGASGTGVRDVCWLQCGCWEPGCSLLRELQVFVTAETTL